MIGLMLPLLFAAATFASTMLGGVLALRLSARMPRLLGFAAGVLLGVVSFEIFPEIIAQVRDRGFDPRGIMIALVGGFLLFHVLEKLLAIHHSQEGQYAAHRHPQTGRLSALALAGHSLMDGVGIGLGFQVGRGVGIIVALAVITHDFTDGMNTVTLMLSHKNSEPQTRPFLVLDAVAPIAGVLLTRVVAPSPHFLVLYLGFFAGFLLYISTSDILPEAHSQESSALTILMTVLGTLFIFAVSGLI